MKFTPTRYAAALVELADGKQKKEIDELSRRFIEHLGRRGKLRLAAAAITAVEREVRRKSGRVGVRATVAHEDPALEKKLSAALDDAFGKGSYDLSVEIDASLIGGVKIIADDVMIDASIRRRLEKIRHILRA